MINKKNRGISLISLAVTILVSLILVSIAVAATGNAIENANITQYIDNLNLIRDSVEAYYISNGSFPIVQIDNGNDGRNYYTQKELLELISSNKSQGAKETFIYDMKQNEDYYDDENLGEFYIVDISKLGIQKTEIGNGARSSLDVFAFSYPSMNIYYLEGMELKGDMFFSLNKRLTYISNLSSDEDEANVSSGISVETLGGLTITKNNAKWTNELNLNITGDEITSGNIKIRLSGTDTEYTLNKDLTGSDEVNLISDFNYNDKLTTNISSEDINAFNLIPSSERYIEIINNTSSVKMSLSNYDDKAPEINSCDITNNSEMTILTYYLEDYDSKVKEIRYEYLAKFDENGTEVEYSNDEITKEYMLTKAKKVRVLGSNNVSIKLPKNISKVRVYIIDNAGNIRYEDRVVKDNYVLIDADINYFYSDGFNFSLAVDGEYDRIETSVITSNESSIDYRSVFNEAPQNVDLIGFTAELDTIYLKVNVISTSNGKEVENIKNFRFDLIGNYPYIPSGFYYVGGTKDTGLIISDNVNDKSKGESYDVTSSLLGNQFVWIPVDIDSSSVQNLKTKWFRTAYESGAEYTSTSTRIVLDETYTEPLVFQGVSAISDERKLYNNVLSGVQKYKGFYVGRYETGIENATTPRTEENVDEVNTLAVKKDLYVYNFIKFGTSITDFSSGATYLANNMYSNNSQVGSNLIFGIQWDHIMKFTEKNVSNSISWGNYLDSENNNTTYKTGTNSEWAAKNIYDLAGNVSEWTMEAYSNSSRVTRGGNLKWSGASESAASRHAYEPATASELIGFRVCLYLK